MSTENEQRMSTVAEFHLAEVPQYEQDCQIVKQVLTHLIGLIQEAEAEAQQTGWADEQAKILTDVLHSAQWKIDNLAYELRASHLDVLKYEQYYTNDIPNCARGGR